MKNEMKNEMMTTMDSNAFATVSAAVDHSRFAAVVTVVHMVGAVAVRVGGMTYDQTSAACDMATSKMAKRDAAFDSKVAEQAKEVYAMGMGQTVYEAAETMAAKVFAAEVTA